MQTEYGRGIRRSRCGPRHWVTSRPLSQTPPWPRPGGRGTRWTRSQQPALTNHPWGSPTSGFWQRGPAQREAQLCAKPPRPAKSQLHGGGRAHHQCLHTGRRWRGDPACPVIGAEFRHDSLDHRSRQQASKKRPLGAQNTCLTLRPMILATGSVCPPLGNDRQGCECPLGDRG